MAWKASGVAREVASLARQMPPAPRKVGRPEEAERPAPRRARMRLEERRWEVKSAGIVVDEVVVVMVRTMRAGVRRSLTCSGSARRGDDARDSSIRMPLQKVTWWNDELKNEQMMSIS